MTKTLNPRALANRVAALIRLLAYLPALSQLFGYRRVDSLIRRTPSLREVTFLQTAQIEMTLSNQLRGWLYE